eukprot:8820398-Pyramimonas_sp.AAC.1
MVERHAFKPGLEKLETAQTERTQATRTDQRRTWTYRRERRTRWNHGKVLRRGAVETAAAGQSSSARGQIWPGAALADGRFLPRGIVGSTRD